MSYLRKKSLLDLAQPAVDLTPQELARIFADFGVSIGPASTGAGSPGLVVATTEGNDVLMTWLAPGRLGVPPFTHYVVWLHTVGGSLSSVVPANTNSYRFVNAGPGTWTPEVWAVATGGVGQATGLPVTISGASSGNGPLFFTPDLLPAQLTDSGPIVAATGALIQGLRITGNGGPLILIPGGVHDVEIMMNEVGPNTGPGDGGTGGLGIFVEAGAYNIKIHHNVIHDVVSGYYTVGAWHPQVIESNYFYGIRGPFARGQAVQFNGVRGGSGQSKVRYNISDVMPGVRYGRNHRSFGTADPLLGVEDHINMYDSSGTEQNPIEIAHNHVRGGHNSRNSGSAIILGDSGGEWIWAHHNTGVQTRNAGICIAGGRFNRATDNRIFMDARLADSAGFVNIGMYVDNYAGNAAVCDLNAVTGNRVFCFGAYGQNPWWDSGVCTNTTLSTNAFGDETLSSAIFMDGY